MLALFRRRTSLHSGQE